MNSFLSFFLADIYEAIYPYEATDPADLSFNTGDRIIVLKREGDWWTGKIGDRVGTFPNNYVQKIENVKFTNKQSLIFFFIRFLLSCFSHYHQHLKLLRL